MPSGLGRPCCSWNHSQDMPSGLPPLPPPHSHPCHVFFVPSWTQPGLGASLLGTWEGALGSRHITPLEGPVGKACPWATSESDIVSKTLGQNMGSSMAVPYRFLGRSLSPAGVCGETSMSRWPCDGSCRAGACLFSGQASGGIGWKSRPAAKASCLLGLRSRLCLGPPGLGASDVLPAKRWEGAGMLESSQRPVARARVPFAGTSQCSTCSFH